MKLQEYVTDTGSWSELMSGWSQWLKTLDQELIVKQERGLLKRQGNSSVEGLREKLSHSIAAVWALPGLGSTILSWNYLCDWLGPSQLPAEQGHLPVPILIEQNILRGSGQLVLALRPATHILQLPSVILIRGLLFLWEACCSQAPSDICF
jgi:hypothetical protein